MFDSAEKKESGIPWRIIGGGVALVVLLIVGYLMMHWQPAPARGAAPRQWFEEQSQEYAPKGGRIISMCYVR